MMGVGKTSIGRYLAKALNVPFRDSDHEVEQASGCSVSDIYELYGEQAFIDVEKRVIKRLMDEPPHVLSTGVGSFIPPECRELIAAKGISIWLDASYETLLPRVKRRDHRPQLELEDGEKEGLLQKYIDEYYPIYAEADYRINCDNQLPDKTVQTILEQLR
jgi:shikimate kinase